MQMKRIQHVNMLETILILVVYLISDMHQMLMKYLDFYEKFIFSVNKKTIFYELTTK